MPERPRDKRGDPGRGKDPGAGKPPVANPLARRGMTIIPPFPFAGMSTRVFPLRASVEQLRRLCDAYLNIVPPEVGWFKPAGPYIQLLLIDYGRMSIKVRNAGWIAQREIVFNVPLEWHKKVDGELRFHDWASFSPFIYVDDDMSMFTGRTVYGWPKVIAKLTPTVSSWIKDPLAPTDAATVSTQVFRDLYTGSEQEIRPFLEVRRDAPVSAMRLPFDPQNPLNPWTMWAGAASAVAGFGRDVVSALNAAGVWPMDDATNIENYIAMAGKAGVMAFPPRPELIGNTINLKQFRLSDEPTLACYQALTNGPMKFDAFNAGGLLGEERMVMGDMSGGFTVRLHDWPSLPIIESLGLEVANSWEGGECTIADLEPVMPFWYNVDMTYEPGETLVWRSHNSGWQVPGKRKAVDLGLGDDDTGDEAPYNTTLGAAQAALAGPFRFSDTTIRVLPLLAYRKTLQKYLDELNAPLGEHLRFEVWAPPAEDSPFAYVYLAATTFGAVTSESNNIGDWAKIELGFFVPVKTRKKNPDTGEWYTAGVGLVPALMYVDNVTAEASRSEVIGMPTLHAEFESPASAWMSNKGPSDDVDQPLLRVSAEMAPVIGEGQPTERRVIVEISRDPEPDALRGVDLRVATARWAAMLRDELKRKYTTKAMRREEFRGARSLVLEMLGNQVPLSFYTLKEVRDVADPQRTCYQSVVRLLRKFQEVLDMREIEERLLVYLHEYPTHPIVEMLGLVGKSFTGENGGNVWVVEPIRPFWMQVTMDELLGEGLMARAGTSEWSVRDGIEFYLGDLKNISVSRDDSREPDRGDPRMLGGAAAATRGADVAAQLGNQAAAALERLTPDDALAALDAVDPQLVLEAVLSREWGNWDMHARWRQGRRDLERDLENELQGQPRSEMGYAERDFFSRTREQLGTRPGETPITDAEEAEDRLFDLTTVTNAIEANWATLSRYLRAAEMALRRDAAKVPEAAKTYAAVRKFVADVKRTNKLTVVGEPVATDPAFDLARGDNQARLNQLVTHEFPELLRYVKRLPPDGRIPRGRDEDETRQIRAEVTSRIAAAILLFREAMNLCRERCQYQRMALLNLLSRGWQKPDFCVRRDSAGADRNRYFPLDQSWDEDWYVGPAAAESQSDRVRAAGGKLKGTAAGKVAKKRKKKAKTSGKRTK